MSKDTWIICTPSTWDAIAPLEGETPPVWAYTYDNAVTGFWKSSGSREVYNVIGGTEAIQALIDALEAHTAGSVAASYSWEQGPATDSLDFWPTDPTEVLALMKDHVTYDQDGNPTGSTPPTIENPNWAHVFLGQSPRIFAGEFSNEFTGEFL